MNWWMNESVNEVRSWPFKWRNNEIIAALNKWIDKEIKYRYRVYNFSPCNIIVLFWGHLVNTMCSDALAPSITRSSAAMALTMWQVGPSHPLHKGFWVHDRNKAGDSWRAKLWHDLIIIVQEIATPKFTWFGLYAHKHFVKWATGFNEGRFQLPAPSYCQEIIEKVRYIDVSSIIIGK